MNPQTAGGSRPEVKVGLGDVEPVAIVRVPRGQQPLFYRLLRRDLGVGFAGGGNGSDYCILDQSLVGGLAYTQ